HTGIGQAIGDPAPLPPLGEMIAFRRWRTGRRYIRGNPARSASCYPVLCGALYGLFAAQRQLPRDLTAAPYASLAERDGNQVIMVAGVQGPIRICRMSPVDGFQLAPSNSARSSGPDEWGARNLVITFGRELGNDQLAAIVVDEIVISVTNQKGCRP